MLESPLGTLTNNVFVHICALLIVLIYTAVREMNELIADIFQAKFMCGETDQAFFVDKNG